MADGRRPGRQRALDEGKSLGCQDIAARAGRTTPARTSRHMGHHTNILATRGMRIRPLIGLRRQNVRNARGAQKLALRNAS
jgi:hypothetical protein